MVKSVAARQPVAVGRRSSARRHRLVSPLGLPEEISLIRDIIYDDFLTLALPWWLPSPVSTLSTRAVLPRAPETATAPDREAALSGDRQGDRDRPSLRAGSGHPIRGFPAFS